MVVCGVMWTIWDWTRGRWSYYTWDRVRMWTHYTYHLVGDILTRILGNKSHNLSFQIRNWSLLPLSSTNWHTTRQDHHHFCMQSHSGPLHLHFPLHHSSPHLDETILFSLLSWPWFMLLHIACSWSIEMAFILKCRSTFIAFVRVNLVNRYRYWYGATISV